MSRYGAQITFLAMSAAGSVIWVLSIIGAISLIRPTPPATCPPAVILHTFPR